MPRLQSLLLALLALLALPAPLAADITGFIGASRLREAPIAADEGQTRLTKGLSVGFGLIIVGFEFEWAQTTGDDLGDGSCGSAADARLRCAPTLTTGMANVLLQTPRQLAPVQFYATAGAGGYRERYRPIEDNDYGVGTNVGGGVKIDVAGPFRVRLDYRLFKLANDAFHDTPQRFYVGANLAF